MATSAWDDTLEVRGLSALLPPNVPDELEDLDLELTFDGARVLVRISRSDRGWTTRRYMRTAQGSSRGEQSGPGHDIWESVYYALLEPLIERLMEEEVAIDHPGLVRKFGETPPPERLETPDGVFGPPKAQPRPPKLGGPAPGVEDSRFLRCVPGPERAVPYAGGMLRVLMVELYEEGIAVSWHVNGAQRMHEEELEERGNRAERVNPTRFRVTDDTGARYSLAGAQTQHGSHHVRGRLVLRPGVPPHAAHLAVTIDGHRFKVDLRNER